MSKKRSSQTALNALLHSDTVRRVERDGQTWFSAQDIVGHLTESQHPAEAWADLKKREPHLADLAEHIEMPPDAIEAVDLSGLLRIAQEIASPKADRIKAWLADAAQARLEEAEDPELAILRARRLYEQRGYSRQWIDSRLSATSARQDLAGEWYRRGARESDQFRELTNELIKSAFGMDG